MRVGGVEEEKKGNSFPEKTQFSLIYISDGQHIRLKHILKATIQ